MAEKMAQEPACEGGVPAGFITCPVCGATANDFCAVTEGEMTRAEAQETLAEYHAWRASVRRSGRAALEGAHDAEP